MGSPRYPTRSQIQQLREAAELPAAETHPLENNQLTLTLPTHGLALVELK
jgi:hypothetical protein